MEYGSHKENHDWAPFVIVGRDIEKKDLRAIERIVMGSSVGQCIKKHSRHGSSPLSSRFALQ